MSSHDLHVRTKVFALLVSLVALWAFAAYVTVQDGLSLLFVNTLDQKIGRPANVLINALQNERRLSVIFVASGNGSDRTALSDARATTDGAANTFRRSVSGSDARMAATTAAEQRISDLLGQLKTLPTVRASIDDRQVDRGSAAALFTGMVDIGFRIYGSLSTLDNQEIAREDRTITTLNQAREVLSQEDALLSGVLVGGRFVGTEPEQFTQLVGLQRYLLTQAGGDLPATDHVLYQQLVESSTFVGLRSLEDTVVTRSRTGGTPGISAQAWQAATVPAFDGLGDLVTRGIDNTIARARPIAVGVIVRLALAGGLGLIAVIASIAMSITTARSLVRQLQRLGTAARDLATKRLPSVVERLGRGEDVDVAAEAPPLTFGTGEIGQVGDAFNTVQETAIRVAVEQAELRRSVRDVFLSLARRTQALVHRQLSLLDAMERRETDSEELADLFRLDHLATRMRRNAENLIVLSGAAPGRGWRRSVPMVDVIRGAVAEVEDYTRVTVLAVAPVGLAGRAVGDVIHLLAELIENAASFSPPYTSVQVTGNMVANGFAVEIEDRGLGMKEEDLVAVNDRIGNPPEFNLSSTARLGLYVVSRLAERHDIRVRLKDSPYGGITAVVLIPPELIVGESDTEEFGGGPGGYRWAIAGDEEPPGEVTANGAGAAVDVGADAGIDVESGWQSPARLFESGQRAVGVSLIPGQRPDWPNGDGSGADARPAIPMPSEVDALAEFVAEPEAANPIDATGQDGADSPTAFTPSGLPFRVRQANLVPQLRKGLPPEPPEDPGRPPDEIRRIMSSYQSGTLRGRADAERWLERHRDDAPTAAGGLADPPEDEPLAPPANETPAPPEDEPSTPPGDVSSTPPGDEPSTPPGDVSSTPPEDEVSARPGDGPAATEPDTVRAGGADTTPATGGGSSVGPEPVPGRQGTAVEWVDPRSVWSGPAPASSTSAGEWGAADIDGASGADRSRPGEPEKRTQ